MGAVAATQRQRFRRRGLDQPLVQRYPAGRLRSVNVSDAASGFG